MPPIVVSIALLLEPVIGAIIGWIWTSDVLIGLPTVIGGVMMISGAILVTLQERGNFDDESVS